MTLTNILLSVMALFVFLNWYEHSKELPRVTVKYKNLLQNFKSIFKG